MRWQKIKTWILLLSEVMAGMGYLCFLDPPVIQFCMVPSVMFWL
jgi:hypothetical protein